MTRKIYFDHILEKDFYETPTKETKKLVHHLAKTLVAQYNIIKIIDPMKKKFKTKALLAAADFKLN